MPRQAHGRPLLASGPTKTQKRKPAKGRGLNALETAEREFPQQVKIRQHRLGEAEDDNDASNTRADADGRSSKRQKVDHSPDKQDEEDGGSDPDGNPWHVGVEDDEDSDIDSDDAFGESDEERFADFIFRGSSKQEDKPQKPRAKQLSAKKLDLEEDEVKDEDGDSVSEDDGEEASDEDDFGDDAIDLATAWDMDDEEQREEREKAARKKIAQRQTLNGLPDGSDEPVESLADDESEDDIDQEDDAFGGFDISEDEQDEETTARLRSFVDGLTPAEQTLVKSAPQRINRNLPDKPSAFALPSAPISAADLMQYIKDPTQRQSLKILQQAEKEDGTSYKGGIPGKLAAPLAKRQQDRLDRAAAYDQTKQTLERWVDTVKNNRRAEHVSFPLVDHTKASASGVKALRPVSAGAPQSELESKIKEIMQESGFSMQNGQDIEDEEQKYEELKEKQIPLEEVQARRRELRMQRELMFREEIRAKRIKKIKSKAYRRVHRKEKDKFAVHEHERLAAAGLLNSDEERERNDRKRAEERMGARHKESRWAKAAKASGQTTWNEDAKIGVSEMARRDEELRKRVEGKNIHGSDESDGDSESESELDSEAEDADQRWNQKLDSLQSTEQPAGKFKLADMAFMKKAEAERQTANDEELKQLRRAMNGGENLSESESDNEDKPVRQSFGKQTTKKTATAPPPVNRLDFEEKLSDEEDNQEETESMMPQLQSKQPSLGLQPASKAKPPTSTHQAKSTNNLSAATTKTSKSQRNTTQKSSRPQTTQQSTLDDYTSPSESEGGHPDGLDDKDRLALDIFAGDDEEDLRTQFIKEKKQTIKEEGDQVIDNTLPGWGSWTGVGISKKAQNKAKGRFVTTIKGIAPETRKDAKLDRVIVNERRVKKNGKYLAQELPHPFESRSQYERSLRLPMGPEWSTRNHFQDAIKPRVLLKQGQVIKPMAKPVA
ncbi:hypothetical protein LTR64_000620 [Lithohypha guttulata]|uniref:uncharacterized protein n=1 Tax=Lithohypha guttulata TaxID=1690604 RepID=UPI002DDDD6AC|nr:hypothetical protein LTR51_005612 [Lithohypha guttulata]